MQVRMALPSFCGSAQRCVVSLANLLVILLYFSTLAVAEQQTAFYELPRDCELLKRLQGNPGVPAIVVRGIYNATESCSFTIRTGITSFRQIGFHVSKFSNPDCIGTLIYADSPLSSTMHDAGTHRCVREAQEFAPFSSRTQMSVQVSANRSINLTGAQSRFSFELVFTFYRIYSTACDALRCTASRWCVALSLRCDGIMNCEDGSDESALVCRDTQSSGDALGEYMAHVMATVLALLLISVAIGIGLYCRRHRRFVQAHQSRVLELRRRTELARAVHCASEAGNANALHSHADAADLVQPFLAPPDYQTVMLGEHVEADQTLPPSYVEALELTKNLDCEKSILDPILLNEASNAAVFDSPTSSTRVDVAALRETVSVNDDRQNPVLTPQSENDNNRHDSEEQ